MAFRFRLTGIPVTNETLAAMPKYKGIAIGPRERAQEALNSIEKDGKKLQAKEIVHKLHRDFGDYVSVLCMIYNATGDTVSFVRYVDWYGHIYKAPYPTEIGNGQWGVFLHGKSTASLYGSSGAVVYRGRNEKGTVVEFMHAWYNPYSGRNRAAYTEVRQFKHFDNGGVLDGVYYNLYGLRNSSVYDGCFSTVKMEDKTSAMLEGIMTLDGLKSPALRSK